MSDYQVLHFSGRIAVFWLDSKVIRLLSPEQTQRFEDLWECMNEYRKFGFREFWERNMDKLVSQYREAA